MNTKIIHRSAKYEHIDNIFAMNTKLIHRSAKYEHIDNIFAMNTKCTRIKILNHEINYELC